MMWHAVRVFASQVRLGLELALRNRMALVYGFVFPLVFLLAFRALYRHEPVPIALHFGELLTVTILGGACFGLPTALVAERERGVWRRYLLAPVAPWLFIASALGTRFALILLAALLQLGLALALGMPLPLHPLALLLAFSLTALAFMGLGLVIAHLSDNVPTVQALGQCIFLPMLIIGGVAVRLSVLPDWALYASVFFPGRYAVAALQGGVTGSGLAGVSLDLLALCVIGAAALIAGVRLFRWQAGRRAARRGDRGWLLLALGAWILAGALAIQQGRALLRADAAPAARVDVAPAWRSVDPAEFRRIAFERLPPDSGLITPYAAAGEVPEPLAAARLERIRSALDAWPPAQVAEPVQRVRNCLYVAAVADLLQMGDVERFLPQLVLDHLQREFSADDLPRILHWIAMHPEDGSDAAVGEMDGVGLPPVSGPRQELRPRVMLYAFKMLGRLNGDLPKLDL